MKTASQLTPKELEAYRRSALRVRPHANKEIRARRLRAWPVARKAAKILKKEFGGG